MSSTSRGLRGALKAKKRRTAFYDLVLDDPTEAEEAFTAAKSALRLMTLKHDDPDEPARAAAQAVYDAALEGLRAHVQRITFEAIPLHEWEQILADHPPTDAQLAKHAAEVEKAKAADDKPPAAPEWDPVGLIPALFAACVVDDDPLSEAEWAEILAPGGDWQETEKREAFGACLTAIMQPRSVTLPKG